MQIVETIFDALGGATAVANGVGAPVQTAHSWKAKGAIPSWRRSSVLGLAKKRKCDLPPEAMEYLTAGAAQPVSAN